LIFRKNKKLNKNRQNNMFFDFINKNNKKIRKYCPILVVIASFIN